ncbi:inorganic phosphate transporter, partial [Pseudomonas synxantha]|nr:inorganic phosphate transporter [Pseudomonas synxantha]
MATPSLTASPHASPASQPRSDTKPGLLTVIMFFAVLAMGLLFTAYSLMHDVHEM